MLRIGIVVGEPSGDALGAGLIHEIKKLRPDIEIEGILGPRIEAEGGNSHFSMNRLSVMGITEVASTYLELVSVRNRIKHIFLDNPPDVFIGIDAPEFNLGLEKELRECGIKTIHYVSPSVWAWRKNRIYKVAQSADLLLTLFPFESNYYDSVDLEVRCVGHPLAQLIPMIPDTSGARASLNIAIDKTTIAIMPGSRRNEIKSLSIPFIRSAKAYFDENNNTQFISSFTDNNSKNCFQHYINKYAPDLPVTIYTGRSHEVLEACDISLLSSGTITLEAMLFKKPIVVGYITSTITYHILRLLVSSKWIALPNILAQKSIVPEFIQNDVTVRNLLCQIQYWINNEESRKELIGIFNDMHNNMKMDTDREAAIAVLDLCS